MTRHLILCGDVHVTGIEISENYCRIAEARLAEVSCA